MNSAAAKGEVVVIFVGPTKKRYTIYKDIICHHSEYFRAAYSGRWKESDEGVTLEDVEVEVFNLFVHWLYTQEMPDDDESISTVAESEVPDMTLLLKCWVFGDWFLAPVFQRVSHNNYVDWFLDCEPEDMSGVKYADIIWAYNNMPVNCIFAMMIDLQCVVWREHHDGENESRMRSRLPKSFLLAVMLRHDELKIQNVTKDKLRACTYHLHASDEEKQTCQWWAKK
jgi:hypothetical protein